MQGQKNIKS